MSGHRYSPSVVGVPVHEQGVETVDLLSHGVHDGLAVSRTVVEKHIQQRLVGEVAQPSGAGQGDLFNPPEKKSK